MRMIDGDRLLEWVRDLDERGRIITMPDMRFIVSVLAKEASPAEDQEEARAEAEEAEEELDEGLPPGRGGLPAGEFLLKALSGFLLSVLVGAGFAALFLR